ncbi:MAG: DUF916 and DUF3324 domain-containing protein [Vagococcus sp.]|uniref:DUF916 and DUF3324 domain-containing protein n=1 Tax=Vagococcus sp. TaxID=1933889 RepID=UPI002FCA6BBC
MNNNRKKLKNILFASLIFVFCLVNNNLVEADESQKQVPFQYKINFPDNQMNKDVGYYDLKMEPGKEQVIQIEFSNPGKEKTAIGVSLNSAKTNSNGVIEYGDTKIKKDSSLKFDFKNIVSAPKRIELKPGETKDLDIKIKMPETAYDGIVTGGIQLIQENQNNLEEKNGSMVLNEYAYVVGMVLQENDTKVKPKLSLNSVKAGQTNFKNNIYINYSNTEPTFVNNMTTEVQINKKGNSQVLYERKQAKMRMAPNSFIAFPVGMNGEKMVPGDYTAKILVIADDGVREEWTKDFKITEEEADKFNERDVGLVQESGLNWKLIIIIMVGFFALVIVVFIMTTLIRKNKAKKSSHKKKERKGNRK